MLMIMLTTHGKHACYGAVYPINAILKFFSHFTLFHVAVSGRGYGNYALYTHGYGTTYVSIGGRTVSNDHYITYVSYLSGYREKTVNCQFTCKGGTRGTRAPTPRATSHATKQHRFLTNSLLLTNSMLGTRMTGGTRTVGVSNKLTSVISGGRPMHRAPVIPPNTHKLHRLRSRYATYRLYISTYPGRILHPSRSLSAFVRPCVSCRHNCYHPRYAHYSRMYPTKTVLGVSGTRGSSVRVNRTI